MIRTVTGALRAIAKADNIAALNVVLSELQQTQWREDDSDRIEHELRAKRTDLNAAIGRKVWLEPWSSGLQSTPRALAGRLSRLLNALGEVNGNVAKGTLVSELRDMRINIHQNLQANGWRVTATANGWKVLPPLERKR